MPLACLLLLEARRRPRTWGDAGGAGSRVRRRALPSLESTPHETEERSMKTWSKPAFEDLRLGFEINLYINNR
jgi:coenzyme PQQ precursor peptide PqqA